jgi:capsular polysaccharide export protein
VHNKVSKYNLGQEWHLPPGAAGKKVILVPGQVEDDASILTGTLSVNTNRDLLRTVRERNPGAFIVFKPHPDVLVGNKGQVVAEDVAVGPTARRWTPISFNASNSQMNYIP